MPILLLGKLRIIWYVFCLPLIIIQTINIVYSKLFIYICTNDRGIISKAPTVNTFIEWGRILGVYKSS
ncbi:MAG: hypothetical protein PHX70_06495 [Clostridium sp.]|nr:hypothetical protein [Clostridium sp.]